MSNVTLKPLISGIVLLKNQFFVTANKADVFHIIQVLASVVSQLGKGIDDNSEEYVKHNNFDQYVEGRIMYHFNDIVLCQIQVVYDLGAVTNASIAPQSIVQ